MDHSSIKIFTESPTPRLSYIAGIILGDILGLEWEIVADKRKIGKYPVINYSAENVKGSFKIEPSGLLNQKGTVEQNISVSEYANLPCFFKSGSSADFPFDIFAAAFYMVTRYEEYLPASRDEHGRFRGADSLAARNGFLQKPVVDNWTVLLANALLHRFPSLAFRRNRFSSLVTFDVDQPFEYLGKDVIHSLGGLIRDIGKGEGRAGTRYRTVRHEASDPFDVFGFIEKTISENKASACFFFPVCDRSKFDKNPSWQNSDYRNLIVRLSEKHNYGMHPSYYSNTDSEKIAEEKARLMKISGKGVNSSRFHYLRITFPESVSALEKAGITEDYTMGFADLPGFRAGIARPYFFYNLSEERNTSVRMFPLQVMDVTLWQYMGLSPEKGGEVIDSLLEETRRAGGVFISLWHNTSLLDDNRWKGWRELFSDVLKKCRND